jgi:hypothetical protein
MGSVSTECRPDRTLLLLDFPGKSTSALVDQSAQQTRQILDQLPPDTDSASIVLSNKPVSSKPYPERERRLIDLPGVELQQVGLKCVFEPDL